jgi:hypothetical protein
MIETSENLQEFTHDAPLSRVVIPYYAASECVAVARCCMAYEGARKTAIDRRKGGSAAEEIACKAFKQALPALHGRERIRDFVACVAQGSIMDVFSDSESKRLLYAAQVAQASTDRPTAHDPRHGHTPTPTPFQKS